MQRRLGTSEEGILIAQSNLARTYQLLGRSEEALHVKRDVYSGRVKLNGVEHRGTLEAANNYADCLVSLKRHAEARSLMRKTIPVARHVLGGSHELMLRMRTIHAATLYLDTSATLDELREAVTTLEDTERIARRVLGGAHPLTEDIGTSLRESREALSARDVSSISGAFAAMTPSDAQDPPS